jgi:hypothetical protein
MIMGKLYNLMVALVQELSGIQACMTTFWERLGRKPHHTIQRDGKTVAAGPSDTRHHADDRHHDDFPVSSLNVYECRCYAENPVSSKKQKINNNIENACELHIYLDAL